MKKAGFMRAGFTQKIRDLCKQKAIKAIRNACREEDELGDRIIGDLSTVEIENRIIKAVEKALS